MNERIDELMIEAGARFEFLHGVHYDDFQYKKFAELIVAECLGIVDDAERGGSNDIWDNAVKFIRRDLQEHFGVSND
jgi:hypothetical protein